MNQSELTVHLKAMVQDGNGALAAHLRDDHGVEDVPKSRPAQARLHASLDHEKAELPTSDAGTAANVSVLAGVTRKPGDKAANEPKPVPRPARRKAEPVTVTSKAPARRAPVKDGTPGPEELAKVFRIGSGRPSRKATPAATAPARNGKAPATRTAPKPAPARTPAAKATPARRAPARTPKPALKEVLCEVIYRSNPPKSWRGSDTRVHRVGCPDIARDKRGATSSAAISGIYQSDVAEEWWGDFIAEESMTAADAMGYTDFQDCLADMPVQRPARKAAANGGVKRSEAKRELARAVVTLVTEKFADLPEEQKADIAYWLHWCPTGDLWWPENFPEPTTAGWIRGKAAQNGTGSV